MAVAAPADDRQLTNIVLMGMGEPLYNYDNVAAAMKIVMDPEGLSISRRKITLSTAGVVPMIRRCGAELAVNLAISLHAVRDEVRDRLVPLNRKYPIAELLDACRNYPGASNARRITFEYVMLKGVNDSPAEARELVRLIAGIPAKVNLIPFNAWPGAPYECSSDAAIAAFSDIVFAAGYSAPVRTPRGRDIFAACGQLKSASIKLRRSAREATVPAPYPRPSSASLACSIRCSAPASPSMACCRRALSLPTAAALSPAADTAGTQRSGAARGVRDRVDDKDGLTLFSWYLPPPTGGPVIGISTAMAAISDIGPNACAGLPRRLRGVAGRISRIRRQPRCAMRARLVRRCRGGAHFLAACDASRSDDIVLWGELLVGRCRPSRRHARDWRRRPRSPIYQRGRLRPAPLPVCPGGLAGARPVRFVVAHCPDYSTTPDPARRARHGCAGPSWTRLARSAATAPSEGWFSPSASHENLAEHGALDVAMSFIERRVCRGIAELVAAEGDFELAPQASRARDADGLRPRR